MALRHHPGVVGWLRWFILMFGTGHTSSACIFYLAVDIRPIHCRTCQLLHPLRTKVSQVEDVQDLRLHCFREHHTVAIGGIVIRHRKRSCILLELLDVGAVDLLWPSFTNIALQFRKNRASVCGILQLVSRVELQLGVNDSDCVYGVDIIVLILHQTTGQDQLVVC